jgi:hypothetical protein
MKNHQNLGVFQKWNILIIIHLIDCDQKSVFMAALIISYLQYFNC